MAAGKERPQPPEDASRLISDPLAFLKKLDSKANHHLEYNDLKEKLPKVFENLEKRKLGKSIEVEVYDDNEELVATEKIGFILPAQTDNKGKVSQAVAILGNGLILLMEPRLPYEKVARQFHKDYSPNESPFQIVTHKDILDKKMSNVATVLREDCKILVDSDCEPQVPEALDALDNATVFAWNLKKSRERGLHKSSKGALTIFDRFIRAFDIDPLDPPRDMPPAQEQPPAK